MKRIFTFGLLVAAAFALTNCAEKESIAPVQKETVETKNQSEGMIFEIEKQLKELGDKIPADKKAPIEAALEKLKEAHKSQDLAAIDAAMNELNTAFQAASAEMYAQTGGQQAGPQPGADAGQQGGQQGDHIQDADFEEVK